MIVRPWISTVVMMTEYSPQDVVTDSIMKSVITPRPTVKVTGRVSLP